MNDQANSLRKRFNDVKKDRKGKTVSIISGKGGVGKSNFALNFSLELIKNGKKVILLDLDIGMGNIDVLLGIYPKHTITDMLIKKLPVKEIIEKGPKGLSYIAGGSSMSQIFQFEEKEKNHFYKQYEKLLQLYDYIIFDLGAGFSEKLLFFVLASDEGMIITTPEPTSLTDAYSVIKLIAQRKAKIPLHVLMNKCISEAEGEQSLEKFQQVVSHFLKFDVKKLGVLPEDKIVPIAVKRQIPYLLLENRAPISKSIQLLTKNYLKINKNTKPEKTPSFIERFKQLLKEWS